MYNPALSESRKIRFLKLFLRKEVGDVGHFIYVMPDEIEPPNISSEFRAKIESTRGKRPKIVLEHILKYGYITTQDLSETYGYEHPPRAIADVRENGITLKKTTIKVNGKSIASYTLPDEEVMDEGKRGGRRNFPKRLKLALLAQQGEICSLCGGKFPGNILQIDHRVPYEVVGDKKGELEPKEFMLVCGSCNRAKSWTCEHCENWKISKNVHICNTCIFGSPEGYMSIAMKQKRSLALNWIDGEVQDYEKIEREAAEVALPMEVYVKNILRARDL